MSIRTAHARSGNAVVLAVGVMALAGVVIATTTDAMVVSVGNVKRDIGHQKAVAAVSLTLIRRERLLAQAATLGAEGFVRRFDPEYDYDLDTVGFVGQENYGVDYVGDVQVRWRIQPAKARENGAWKQNPRADGEAANLELPNTFLFRVEAEARQQGDGSTPGPVVQGVRYSAITKNPLFRYIIFYSQEGPKGDIEFAHGPAFAARGSVHTNGSIYLGGGAIAASWDALKSGLISGTTALGPFIDPYDASIQHSALVNAYDGIFRLSKQVLYNRANSFQIAGTAPSGFNASTWYDIDDDTIYPGESGSVVHYRKPPSSAISIADATHGGTEINPHRVKDGQGLATSESSDTKRTINGNAVRGVDEGTAKANDSRDRHRTGSALVWSTDSLGANPNGFDKMARTSDNGGRIVQLPAIMGDRAFEAQKIRYEDLDGDPTTDNHEYARPIFLVAGSETASHPDAAGPVVEAPGSYLGFALGSSELAMTRVMRNAAATSEDISGGYNAWQVTAKNGGAIPAMPESMGLIIRERMQPDLNYLDGPPTSSASPDYIPYSYGKHMRVSRWPVWPVDISARVGSDATTGMRNANGFVQHAYTQTSNTEGAINSTLRSGSYADGGTLSLAAAADQTIAGSTTDTISGYTRYPVYHRNTWTMFHLQRPVPDEGTSGLLATATYDFDATKSWLPSSGWLGPFAGPVVKRAIWGSSMSATSFTSFLSGTLASGENYFAVRWTGFIKPKVSGAHTFALYTDDGGRLWVNDIRLADGWVTQSGTSANSGGEVASINLEKDIWYPIVIEMFDKDGGQKMELRWSAPGLSSEIVPIDNLAPPKSTTNAGAFNRSDWKAVQAKLVPGSGTADGKMGLMVRPLANRVTIPGTRFTVVREAEHYTRASSGTGTNYDRVWSTISSTYVQATPDTGKSDTTTTPSYNGPTLDYDINLPAAGTYKVWLRARGVVGSNGVHVRRESGSAYNTITNGANVSRTPNGVELNDASSWRWISRNASGPMSFTVSSAGKQRLRIQMALDGIQIDKLVLSTEASPIPMPYGGTLTINNDGTSSGSLVAGTYTETTGQLGPNGLPTLVDGSGPYLSLVYNPARGIVAEFRGEAADSEGRQPTRLFTGTSTATDDYGEQTAGIASATRIATITPTQLTSNDDTQTIVSSSSDNNTTGNGSDTPTTSNGITTSEGGYDNVIRGAWSRYRSYKRQITLQRRVSTAWRFTLGGTALPSTQVFHWSGDNPDTDKTITFYSDSLAATTTTSPASFALSTNGSPSLSNRTETSFDATWTNSAPSSTLDWSDTSGFVNGSTSTVSSVTVGDTTFTNVGLTTTVSGATVNKTWTFGDSNTYWYINSNPPKYAGTSTTVPYSNFKANIEALNASAKVVRITSGSTPSNPATFTVPLLPNPPSDYLGYPGAPTAWGNGATQRTFSIDRTGWMIFDQNPYVTAHGSWWFGADRQMLVRPWNDILWSAIAAPPLTGSFRPDLWDYRRGGTTSPGFFPRRSGMTESGTSTTTDPAGSQVATPRWTSDQPVAWPPSTGLPANVWLRIERSTGNMVRMRYAFSDTAPTTSDWTDVLGIDGSPATWSIAAWNPDLLIGPCLQSGNRSSPQAVSVSDVSVEFHADQTAPDIAAVSDDVRTLNHLDWEAASPTSPASGVLYMAGQYQVFFGPYEITEDFFSWLDANDRPAASENWIYQLREFWSQSAWWNTFNGTTPATNDPKDPSNQLPTSLTPTTRELLARSTLLNIDMASLQSYLRSRTLNEAVENRIDGAGPSSIPTPSAGTLASRFNGLFYFARSNRYPWNPSTQGKNPWNVALPNSTESSTTSNSELLAMDREDRQAAFAALAAAQATLNQTKLHHGSSSIVDHLQPYETLINDQAPAFKPTQFHHGVRLVNGTSIDWAFSGASSEFGTGKTAVITPNLLYVQGDFNTVKHNVIKNNVANTAAYVPVALVGDQINFLSATWNDGQWRTPGITADASGLTSACITAQSSLARGWNSSLPLPTAGYASGKSSVDVVAALITHNQPTTRASVRDGEAASIIGTMLFLENWGGKAFNYTGSLVVMDSRRYTGSFQLDASKPFGPSPFGYMSSSWRSSLSLTNTETWWGPAEGTKVPAAYVAPDRSFTFNPDLLTPQGTPPFAPFGTSSFGIGGWIRIIR